MESHALPLKLYALGLALAVLLAGACIAGPDQICRLGAVPCDGACIDPQRNPNHCGACGQMCGAAELCVNGTCSPACGTEANCGDACASLADDPRHCGACDRACSDGEVCRDGDCQTGCDGGARLCEGRCTDVAHDEASCGDCGVACAPGQVCREGRCECSDILTDPLNCGTCGLPCAQGSTCSQGACVPLCSGRPCLSGETLWAQRIGETGGAPLSTTRDQDVRALAYDPSGRLFVAMEAKRTVHLLGAEVGVSVMPNLVLAELDGRGQVVRAFHPPGDGLEIVYAMEIDDGALLVAGHYDASSPLCGLPPHQGNHDGFLLRFDLELTTCTPVATITSPGDARFEGLSVGRDTIALAARFEGPATLTLQNGASVDLPHAGAIDALVVALDRDGNLRWLNTLASPSDDIAADVVVTPAGVVATGSYEAPFSPSLATSQNGQDAMWIGQYDLDGSENWILGVPVISSNGSHRAEGVALAHDDGRTWLLGEIRGAVDVAGVSVQSHVSTKDVVLFEFDDEGTIFRRDVFGDEGTEDAGDVYVDARGVTLTGRFERRIDFGLGLLEGAPDNSDDVFVAAFARDGTPQWNRVFGGRNDEDAQAVTSFRGRVTVGGKFERDVDLGLGTLFSPQRLRSGGPSNEDDAFLITISR